MKFPIDLVLITLLIVLMYCQPGALGGITTSVLGRIIAVCLIAHIALAYGRNAGLLAALIFILLLHNNREGFTPKSSKKNLLRRHTPQKHQVQRRVQARRRRRRRRPPKRLWRVRPLHHRLHQRLHLTRKNLLRKDTPQKHQAQARVPNTPLLD